MTEFTFSNPDFESRVRANFARQGMLTMLGGEIGLVRPGEVHLLLRSMRALPSRMDSCTRAL